MNQRLNTMPSDLKSTSSRRHFIKMSLIAGAAGAGIVAVGTAVQVTQAAAASQPVPFYRLVKTDTTFNHFYTTSASEKDRAVAKNGFRYEHVACYLFPKQVEGSVPLHRLVKATRNVLDHLYTTSVSEKDRAVANNGYRYEHVAGYVFPRQVKGSIPLYRLVKTDTTFDHFYTTSASEKDRAVAKNGYRYEHVAGYVFQNPS